MRCTCQVRLLCLSLLPFPFVFFIYLSPLLPPSSPQLSPCFAMKHLIRRLSRVSDSSHYCPLPDSPDPGRPAGRVESFSAAAVTKLRRAGSFPVPRGHVPVYVGDELERFVVSAELLNHPVFVSLLDKSAQEYGYEQQGVLRIPCHVLIFEQVLVALRLGNLDSGDMENLVLSLSDGYI